MKPLSPSPFLEFHKFAKWLLLISILFYSLQLSAQNLTDGGSVGSNQTICPGETPTMIQNITAASGGGTTPIEYLWMTTTNATNPISGWSIASGTNNNESYGPPPVGVTTYFIRCARRQGFTSYIAESNITVINVVSFPTAIINGTPTTSSTGETVNISASFSSFSTFTWDFDDDDVIDCTGQNCSFTYNNPGIYTISLTVDNGTCSLTTTETITVIGLPLPVEFIDFNATVITGQKVLLKWITGSEFNNNYFEIERSLDGDRFDFIGKIEGYGNSSTNQFYQFIDKDGIEGETYYRLKQVDFDGKYSFSNIISVKIENKNQIATVIPNPMGDKALVRFSGKLPPKAKLQILNSTGQVIQTIRILDSSLEINTSGLEKGFYFLRIKNSAKIEKAFYKIVKI